MKKTITTILLCLTTSICSFANYSVSKRGIELIKSYETCQLTAYWDSNGYSIGYGHHSKNVTRGMKIAKHKAEMLLASDLKIVNAAINRLISDLPVKHKFSQNFIDGLGDLIYNCGEAGVKNSEFYNRLKRCRKNNANDLSYTIAAVKTLKIKYKGNVKRRYEIHKLMLK